MVVARRCRRQRRGDLTDGYDLGGSVGDLEGDDTVT
jgi:hypothetical protein